MSEQLRRMLLYVAIIVMSGSIFTACSGMSISGGVVGSLLSLFGIVVFVLSMSTTQTACDVKPCLSIIAEQPKGDGGVSKDTPDQAPEARVGPCLSRPPPDRGNQDTSVGPCLQPPPPDRGDLDAGQETPPESGGKDEGPKDTRVGPCLTPPPPDKMGMNDLATPGAKPASEKKFASRSHERDDAIKRLQQRGVLPADVAARLKAKSDKKKA